MQRIALCTCLAAIALAGCQTITPRRTLGAPPSPILASRTPAPAIPVAPPPPTTPETPGAAQTLQGATIVVDAGHGGDDPGRLGRGPQPEKTVNLAIAQELAEQLRERGARVVLTRGTDRFISLEGRAAVADRQRADLFVSIHADSAKRATAEGMTLYVARGASAASRKAADCIASAIRRAGLEFRGVQGAGYRVLIAHSRPAVLIESGFLSNRSEAQRLSTSAHQKRIAAAIAEGIAEYAGR